MNSHPHSGGRVTIVHNGIIENYKELKDHLASKGVTFASDTDTEVVAKLLDYRYNGSPIQTISDVIRDLEGSYALGIIFADHPDQVYAVRCESPLIVGVGKGESFIASDVPAIIEYTRDYYLLEHEEIAVLGSDGVHIYDAFGQPVEKELKTADWDVEAIGKNGYAHFMLKEIHEQLVEIARAFDLAHEACPIWKSAASHRRCCAVSGISRWLPAVLPCTPERWANM